MSNEPAETAQTAVPTRSGARRFLTWMAVAAVVLIADQVTKWLILQNIPLYSKIEVMSFVNITHQQNPGAAFSFLADAGGWQRWFFTGLATLVSFFIAGWLWQLRNQRQAVLGGGLALVLGGALGNLVDRLQFGYVIDFIQVLIAGWPFPSFNVADAAISVGAGLLIIDALFLSGRNEAEKATDQ
ncbi:MAG: signal peptidase II [Woeseia sp.]